MPGKGHALSGKPSVNDAHKTAVRATAQRDRKARAESRGDLAKELVAAVDGSQMSSQRKEQAYDAIEDVCCVFLKGTNPFDGLRPPAKCGPCHGQSGGTHYFFCLGRKLNPPVVENTVRQHCIGKLQAAWRRHQYQAQQVRPCCAPPVSATLRCPTPAPQYPLPPSPVPRRVDADARRARASHAACPQRRCRQQQ